MDLFESVQYAVNEVWTELNFDVGVKVNARK